MDKQLIGEALFYTDIKHKDNDFVYLKHKLIMMGKDYRVKSPKFLIDKWEHISTIEAKDIGIIEKGTKTLYKVPLNEYQEHINIYEHYLDVYMICKGHNLTDNYIGSCEHVI